MTVPRPAPDWYPDPVDPQLVRWWDGYRWTQHRTPPGLLPGARPGAEPGDGDRGHALDAAVTQMRTRSPEPWGWRPVLIPLGSLIAVIVLGLLVSTFLVPSGHTARTVFAIVANTVLEGLLAVSVWLAGRPLAERNGGWAVTFGLRRPQWSDLAWAAAGIGIVFFAEGAVSAVANGLTHGRASHEAENLHIHSVNATTVVLLVAVVVVAAPLLEELTFRGLLLRTFMRRWSFWPSAILSTAIFAGLHTYEVHTVVGALTLAGIVSTLGLTNCWLNRRTNSLVPGMLVHGSFNALALVVLIVQAH